MTLQHQLTLYPSLPPLRSLTVSPGSVGGGNSATGTVRLGGPAPPNGVAINLASNLPLSANVPKSVTIPGGATSAIFTVTTFPGENTTAQLSAAMDNTFQFASINVTPSPPPPPPPPTPTPAAPSLVSPASNATGVAQPVALDWSNVANAVSYEVQVDNTSTISAPFVANPMPTASQTTLAAGLPAQNLWWRVRARNASGVFGPFSSTRRFTPQGGTTPAATLTVTASGAVENV